MKRLKKIINFVSNPKKARNYLRNLGNHIFNNCIEILIQHWKNFRYLRRKIKRMKQMRNVHSRSGILVTYRVWWTKKTGFYMSNTSIPYFVNLVTVIQWERLERMPKRQVVRRTWGASLMELRRRVSVKYLSAIEKLKRLRSKL